MVHNIVILPKQGGLACQKSAKDQARDVVAGLESVIMDTTNTRLAFTAVKETLLKNALEAPVALSNSNLLHSLEKVCETKMKSAAKHSCSDPRAIGSSLLEGTL